MLHTVHSTKFLNVPKIYRNFKRFRPVFVDDRISRRRLEEKRDDTIAQDLLFNDSSLSTKSRTTFDLVRALILLRLCKIDRLVDNGEKLVSLCKSMFGSAFYETLMKATIYKQFVAGETTEDVKSVAKELGKLNVNCMFCVPTEDVLEDDINSTKITDLEEQCERNLRLMLNCIDLTASLGNFAQYKITPVISGDVINEIADTLTGYITNHEDRPVHLDVKTWSKALKANVEQHEILPGFARTTKEHVRNGLRRLGILASRAGEKGVKLMLDAEYIHLQSGIDLIILALQQKYNQQTAVVFNTYQCYRKDTPARLQNDIQLAQKYDFKIACKLVRGAYMEYERQLAAEQGYDDPICENIEETERNYKEAIDLMLTQVAQDQGEVMIATHNEECINYGIKRMKELNIEPGQGHVSFGQLYGMCDHVSCELGSAGYNVHKSVPYGTVDDSMLYLLRRARENKDVMARTKKESSILINEIKRRLRKSVGQAL